MPLLSAMSLVRGIWRIFFYSVLLTFAGIVLLVLLAFFGVITPFFGEVHREFVDLPGPEARSRLAHAGDWPEQIDPAAVHKMSQSFASTIDSHSTWSRIELTPAAAATWQDAVHLKQEKVYEGYLDHLDQGVEGVHRTVTGPPPMHSQTGTTPGWWSPPAIDFRATELMKWYKEYQSGVGRATYSAYDAPTRTLWIYEYSMQHELLWSPGDVPAGEQFTTIKQPVVGAPNANVAPGDDMEVDGH